MRHVEESVHTQWQIGGTRALQKMVSALSINEGVVMPSTLRTLKHVSPRPTLRKIHSPSQTNDQRSIIL